MREREIIYMKSQMGSSILTTPIIIAVGMMIVSAMVVLSINIITPYIWYEKLSSTCIKYIFIMEEYGYLTKQEKLNLLDELQKQGFSKNKIIVECTSNIQPYGEKIYLKLKYDYKLELPFQSEESIPMEINRISVSKR